MLEVSVSCPRVLAPEIRFSISERSMWEPVTVRCIPRLGSSLELVWAMLPTFRPRPAPARCLAASADAF